MARAALSLGSNMGDKLGAIDEALTRLDAGGAHVVARSSNYRTEPWKCTDQDWFVNACAIVQTDLSPEELLRLCLGIEQSMGRIRKERWGPRLIDIDILTYESFRIDSPSLTLPHPYILERAFVLVPLAEIAPDLTIDSIKVSEARSRLGDAGVVKLAPTS